MSSSFQSRVLTELLKHQPPKWWADELGVHVSEISRWKSGQRGMSLDQVLDAHRILEGEGTSKSERRAARVASIIAEGLSHELTRQAAPAETTVAASMHGVLAEASVLLSSIAGAMSPDSDGGMAITEAEAQAVEPDLVDVRERIDAALAQLAQLRRPVRMVR